MAAFGAKVPLPELVHDPPLAMVTAPLNVMPAVSEQTSWSILALAVGAGVKESSMVSATAWHVPFNMEVNTMLTLPANLSAAVGT